MIGHVPLVVSAHDVIPSHFLVADTPLATAPSKTAQDKTSTAAASPSTTTSTAKDAATSTQASVTPKSEGNHNNHKRDVVVEADRSKVVNKKTDVAAKIAAPATPIEQVRGQSKFGSPSPVSTPTDTKATIIVPSKVDNKRETSDKTAIKEEPKQQISSAIPSDSAKSNKAETPIVENTKATTHDHHKRETTTVKEDVKKTPSQVSSSAAADKKIAHHVDPKVNPKTKLASLDSKPIPISTVKSNSPQKQIKRETTNVAVETIKPSTNTESIAKDFQTSHRIPEHVHQTNVRNEDGKFQTSHHIPAHPAPVVVGVTPKKAEADITPKSVVVVPATLVESAKKDETVKDTKPVVGSRHRRDTSKTAKVVDSAIPSESYKPKAATPAAVPIKSADHLARVPLTKTTTLVETPKASTQQNGHAAHSHVARTKRDHKAAVLLPVPVDQIVKHSQAAPEIHHQ